MEDFHPYEVEYVFGKKQKEEEGVQYKVKWAAYEKKDSTWEPPSQFAEASQMLISRFEKVYSYKIYYKILLKRIQKQHCLKDPIRIHIRGNYSQTWKKVPEIIDIELESTDDLIQRYKEQKPNYQEDKDKDIIFISKPDNFPIPSQKDEQWKLYNNSHQLSETLNQKQLRSYGNHLNPIKGNNSQGSKIKFKQERDYIIEILFEWRQRSKFQKTCDFKETSYKLEPPIYTQQHETQTENQISQEFKIYDLLFEEIVLQKLPIFEAIISHHIKKNQLLFKCQTEDEKCFYLTFSTLQENCTILMLDYISAISIMI